MVLSAFAIGTIRRSFFASVWPLPRTAESFSCVKRALVRLAEKMCLLHNPKRDGEETSSFENEPCGVPSNIVCLLKVLVSIYVGICFFSPTLAYAECIPNKALSSDKRYMELRWAIGSRSNIVKLRVPIEYYAGVKGCLGPSSLFANSDDNLDIHAHTLAIKASLPDFQPPSASNAALFRAGLGWSAMNILISSITSAIIDKAELEQSKFDTGVGIFLGEKKLKGYSLVKGVKPDKYGLKRIGAIGDFEQYKNKLPLPPADDFYYSDDHPISVWAQCTVEEIKDHSEDPEWRGRPICELNFRNERLDATVKIVLPRIYMDKWRETKIGVEKLIDSFEIQQLNGDRQ
jgi:hypothetical protein